ncbi:hypothetical protein ACMHYR_10150 [Serratia marcescens]|uniref:hypothetical protein n=1 Tax=Serratia marcescens TaxID=615 RepID=UPI0039EC10BE
MLQHLETLQANPTLVNLMVFDAASDVPVRTVALMRIDEANGVLEIGHVSWSPLMKQRAPAPPKPLRCCCVMPSARWAIAAASGSATAITGAIAPGRAALLASVTRATSALR